MIYTLAFSSILIGLLQGDLSGSLGSARQSFPELDRDTNYLWSNHRRDFEQKTTTLFPVGDASVRFYLTDCEYDTTPPSSKVLHRTYLNMQKRQGSKVIKCWIVPLVDRSKITRYGGAGTLETFLARRGKRVMSSCPQLVRNRLSLRTEYAAYQFVELGGGELAYWFVHKDGQETKPGMYDYYEYLGNGRGRAKSKYSYPITKEEKALIRH